MVEVGADQRSIDLLFKAMDGNGDGHISRDEWRAGFHHYSQSVLQAKEGVAYTRAVGQQQQAAAQAASQPASSAHSEADALFTAIDTDKSNTIEDYELLLHMLELGADQSSIDSLFKAIDVNGDGHISRDEWRQGFHHVAVVASRLLQVESAPFVTMIASLEARAATAIQSRWRGRAGRLLTASRRAGASSPTRQQSCSPLARRASLLPGGATDPMRIFEKRAAAVKKKPPATLAAGRSSRSTGMAASREAGTSSETTSPTTRHSSSGLARRASFGGAADPMRIFEQRPPAAKKKPPATLKAGRSSRSTGMTVSVADEVAKLKQLLDSGVLTGAEFEEAKRRELNRR
jgi:Ca2+-binding EF-hand superfamily protein